MRLDTKFLRFAAGTLLVFGLSACADSNRTTADDVKRESSEAAQTTGEYLKQQQQDFEARMDRRIAEIDRKLEELQAKSEKAGTKAKADLKEQMQELNGERRDLGDKLADMKDKAASATKEAWLDMKQGVESAADKLESKLKDRS